MKVCSLLRKSQGYPHEAVLEGIRAAGDEIVEESAGADAVITWNCYGHPAKVAAAVKARGGMHVVMENGYLLREAGYYLMERDGFNGMGTSIFADRGPSRWQLLNEPIHPWQLGGEYVLVVGQRGGSYSPLSMPVDWPDQVLEEIREVTDLPIRYRPHPARQRLPAKLPHGALMVSCERSLDDQIRRAGLVVGWTSSALVRALQLGVPVVYRGPSFVLSGIAYRTFSTRCIESYFYTVEAALYDPREQAFWDLAWRQFQLDEIRSGFAWWTVTRA